jgi:hypothetical protein
MFLFFSGERILFGTRFSFRGILIDSINGIPWRNQSSKNRTAGEESLNRTVRKDKQKLDSQNKVARKGRSKQDHQCRTGKQPEQDGQETARTGRAGKPKQHRQDNQNKKQDRQNKIARTGK